MNHVLIASFLQGKSSARDLAASMEGVEPTATREDGHDEIGAPVVEDCAVVMVTHEAAIRILRAMLDGDLTRHDANHLGNTLITSDDFDFCDELVALAIAFVADENRMFTVAELSAALAEFT